MKLILNRNEVIEIKKLASTIGDICGDNVNRVMDMVDRELTTKKFIMTMITGQFTLEIKEEFIVGLLTITNNLVKDSSPILKACVTLGEALSPIFMKYSSQYKQFLNQYKDDLEMIGNENNKEVI